MQILLVEDSQTTKSIVQKELEEEHYSVDKVSNSEMAKFLLAESEYDLLILDVSTSTGALDVLKYIRAKSPSLPTLVLTACQHCADLNCGLILGADVCLQKSNNRRELLTRVMALLRLSNRLSAMCLKMADLQVDLVNRVVTRSGKRIDLSTREYELLTYLMRNSGRVLSHEKILENGWNMSSECRTNTVAVYINFLRTKIEADFQQKLIHTVRGVGYEMSIR